MRSCSKKRVLLKRRSPRVGTPSLETLILHFLDFQPLAAGEPHSCVTFADNVFLLHQSVALLSLIFFRPLSNSFFSYLGAK